MVESWLVEDWARYEEEKKARSDEEKERYREIAAKRLATERLAAHLQRVDDRDFNLSYAEYSRAVDAREARDRDMPPASKLPPEPPVVLERKALNQLDKRAKTRKLAGPKEAKDDENEHRQHREKKEQHELRNAQTKARNQKRAKARNQKLAA